MKPGAEPHRPPGVSIAYSVCTCGGGRGRGLGQSFSWIHSSADTSGPCQWWVWAIVVDGGPSPPSPGAPGPPVPAAGRPAAALGRLPPAVVSAAAPLSADHRKMTFL